MYRCGHDIHTKFPPPPACSHFLLDIVGRFKCGAWFLRAKLISRMYHTSAHGASFAIPLIRPVTLCGQPVYPVLTKKYTLWHNVATEYRALPLPLPGARPYTTARTALSKAPP